MKGICEPKENGRSGLAHLLDLESVNFAIDKTSFEKIQTSSCSLARIPFT